MEPHYQMQFSVILTSFLFIYLFFCGVEALKSQHILSSTNIDYFWLEGFEEMYQMNSKT